eukprot:426783-Pyramimonas_sp.AAC.1
MRRAQSLKTDAEKVMSTFPIRTSSRSTAERSGSPRGSESLLRRGGPPPRSRAREKLEHGVP